MLIREIVLYGMWIGSKRVADVVRLSNGKCVIAWPTSLEVHDGLEDAMTAIQKQYPNARWEPETRYLPATVTLPDEPGPTS